MHLAYKGRVLKAAGLGVKTKGSTDTPDSKLIQSSELEVYPKFFSVSLRI